jgi:hypothetical protein
MRAFPGGKMGLLYNNALQRLKCQISAGCLITIRKTDRSRAISTGCNMGYWYARIRILMASIVRKQTGPSVAGDEFPHSQCSPGKSRVRAASRPRFSCSPQQRGSTIVSQKEEPNAKP